MFIQFITFDWESCYFHLQLSPPHITLSLSIDQNILKNTIWPSEDEAKTEGKSRCWSVGNYQKQALTNCSDPVCPKCHNESIIMNIHMQTHAIIPRQSLVLDVLFLFLAGTSVTQAASSIHWCLASPGQAPVLTFVSNIKNVPAQNISGRHIYLSCRIYCCGCCDHNKMYWDTAHHDAFLCTILSTFFSPKIIVW